MRKFSAHRIYPVNSPPISFGIVETSDDGTILNIRDTGRKPVEEAGLEFYSGIITPGFVNAHVHLELSHLKGLIPEQTGISGFVSAVSKIRPADSEKIRRSAIQADRIMYRNGISGAGDISNTDTSLKIKQCSQIRYHTFIEVFGLNSGVAAERFSQALKIQKLFNEAGLSCTLSPHAPYSVGTDLWELLARQNSESRRITIHHDESPAERDLLEDRRGEMADSFTAAGFDLTRIPDEAGHFYALLGKYLPDPDWILVHNTMTDPLKVPYPSKPGIYWVLCPRSNQYIENRLPDINAFAASGLTICLGTDSLASNHSLSVLDEMKSVQAAVSGISFETLLQWGTINGARALGMEKILGTIETGKKPGLVHIPVFDWTHECLTENSQPNRLI
ncbi:MAG: amidohydrolase family protein [Bacteroidales bacterium]|jgi:cytosine/adenosine deaminase-related metal-dependent hydrolase